MSKNLKFLFVQIFVMIFGVLSLRWATAADLLVSPVNNYLQVAGGEEKLLDYTLTNQEEHEIHVTLAAVSFRSDDKNGAPRLLNSLEFPYLTLVSEGAEVQEVTVPAASQLPVQVKVAPPLGTAMKEYPLTLFFVASDDGAPAQSGSSLGMQVGSNLIIRLDDSNEDKSNLTLTLSSAPTFFVDTFMSTPFGVLVHNLGPFGTLINGGVRLKQGEREVKTWDFYPDLVLGESSRLARASDGSKDGNGNISLSSDIVLPRFLLGYYTLETYVRSINAPDGIQTVSSLHFLALPYWLLFLVVVLWVVVCIVRKNVTGKKQTKRRMQAEMERLRRQRSFFQ